MRNKGIQRGRQPKRLRQRLLPQAGILGLFLLATMNLATADDGKAFSEHAATAFQQAQAQYQSQKNNPVAAWEFARRCYDWADWATNKTQRAQIAHEGMAAARQSLQLQDSAAAHYYLALNMGQLAQAQMLSGLRLVREMAKEFTITAVLDTNFDFAGAERGLGLLYRDAPGWPMSIGNRHKAREYLESAAALAPNDPENLLNLGESDLKWNDLAGAQKELKALDNLWPKAQKALTGPDWASSWDDWTKRRAALRSKLDQS